MGGVLAEDGAEDGEWVADQKPHGPDEDYGGDGQRLEVPKSSFFLFFFDIRQRQ